MASGEVRSTSDSASCSASISCSMVARSLSSISIVAGGGLGHFAAHPRALVVEVRSPVEAHLVLAEQVVGVEHVAGRGD